MIFIMSYVDVSLVVEFHTGSGKSGYSEQRAEDILSEQALAKLVGNISKLKTRQSGQAPLRVHIVDENVMQSITKNPNIKILQRLTEDVADTPTEPDEQEDRTPSDVKHVKAKSEGAVIYPAMKMKKWTEEGMELAIERCRLGYPLKTTAREFHIPKNTLRNRVQRSAITNKRRKMWTEEQMARAVEQCRRGWPVSIIAQRFQMPTNSLRNRIVRSRTHEESASGVEMPESELTSQPSDPDEIPDLPPLKPKFNVFMPRKQKKFVWKKRPPSQSEFRRITEDVCDEALREILKGQTYEQVAEKLDVSYRTLKAKIPRAVIRKAYVEAGKNPEQIDPVEEAFNVAKKELAKSSYNPKRTCWSPEDMSGAMDLVFRGMKVPAAARLLKIPEETLSVRVKRKRKEMQMNQSDVPHSSETSSRVESAMVSSWGTQEENVSDDLAVPPDSNSSNFEVTDIKPDPDQGIPTEDSQTIYVVESESMGDGVPKEGSQAECQNIMLGGELVQIVELNHQYSADMEANQVDTEIQVVFKDDQEALYEGDQTMADQDPEDIIPQIKNDDYQVPETIRLWTEEGMSQAIEMYKNGTPLKTAAREFYIPYQTLRNRLNRTRKLKCDYDKAHLSKEDEQRLNDYVVSMKQSNHPVTAEWVRHAASLLAKARDKPFPTDIPSHKWWVRFKARYPEMIGIPTFNEFTHAASKPLKGGKKFYGFTDARILLEDLNIIDQPHRIYVVDECCVGGNETDCIQDKIIFPEAEDSLNTSGHVTFTNCASAEGLWMPPMFTFQNSLPETHEYMLNGPANSINMSNDTGRPNKQGYLLYMKHLETFLSQERPVVIFHPNILRRAQNKDLREFCKEHQIHLYSVPKCGQHNLRPLDVVYEPLKSTFEIKYQEAALLMNPLAVSKSKVPILVQFALQSLQEKNMLTEAFRSTGLYPFSELAAKMPSITEPSASGAHPVSIENESAVSSILPVNPVLSVALSVPVHHQDRGTQTEPPVVQLSFRTGSTADQSTSQNAGMQNTSQDDELQNMSHNAGMERKVHPVFAKSSRLSFGCKVELPKKPVEVLPPIDLAELVPSPLEFQTQFMAELEEGRRKKRCEKRKVKQEPVCQAGLVNELGNCSSCSAQPDLTWECLSCMSMFHVACSGYDHEYASRVCHACIPSSKPKKKRSITKTEAKTDLETLGIYGLMDNS